MLPLALNGASAEFSDALYEPSFYMCMTLANFSGCCMYGFESRVLFLKQIQLCRRSWWFCVASTLKFVYSLAYPMVDRPFERRTCH